MLELKIGCLRLLSEVPTSAKHLFYLDCLRSLDILEYLVKFSVGLLFHVALRKCCLLSKRGTCWLWITWEQQLSLASLVVSEPLVPWCFKEVWEDISAKKSWFWTLLNRTNVLFSFSVTENSWCLVYKTVQLCF